MKTHNLSTFFKRAQGTLGSLRNTPIMGMPTSRRSPPLAAFFRAVLTVEDPVIVQGFLISVWMLGFWKGRGQVDIITIMSSMAKMAIKVSQQSKLLLQLIDNGFSKGNRDKQPSRATTVDV